MMYKEPCFPNDDNDENLTSKYLSVYLKKQESLLRNITPNWSHSTRTKFTKSCRPGDQDS